MYCDNLTVCFINYLESKGIKQVENFKNEIQYEDITTALVEEQIFNINEFHTRTLGYMELMNKRLDNNIGKTVEQYKVYIRRLEKELDNLNKKGPSNNFEKQLVEYGDLYLKRAKKCIDNIYMNNYIGLIMRSMNRAEVCLGNTSFDNLRKESILEVRSVDNCCYNMLEMDLIYFLGKIRRKGVEVDFNILIKEFCRLEALESDSEKFILSILSYPYEFMKCCNRYRERTKKWTEDEYALKLEKAILLDGYSLI